MGSSHGSGTAAREWRRRLSADHVPRPGRFAKGRSGNPGGRPKKVAPTAVSAFDIIIDRTLDITQGGRTREVTVEEALQHKTYQEAIAGSRMAQREIMKMIVKREAAKSKRLPPKGKVTVRHETDPDNAREALLLLGIVREIDLYSQKRLRLEPWAVRAALSRRGCSKLTANDIDNAKRETADPETVKWPVGVANV